MLKLLMIVIVSVFLVGCGVDVTTYNIESYPEVGILVEDVFDGEEALYYFSVYSLEDEPRILWEMRAKVSGIDSIIVCGPPSGFDITIKAYKDPSSTIISHVSETVLSPDTEVTTLLKTIGGGVVQNGEVVGNNHFYKTNILKVF